jgi:hypothetical protein
LVPLANLAKKNFPRYVSIIIEVIPLNI